MCYIYLFNPPFLPILNMKKIRLKALLITILSLSIIPSSYAKTMEDKIVKSKRVRIWKLLLKAIVRKDLLQSKEAFKANKPILDENWFDEKTKSLFDEKTKRYVLQVIKQGEVLPSLQQILKNRHNPFDIDNILNTVDLSSNKTLEEVLVEKIIELITIEPKEEKNKDLQETLVVVNDQIKIEVENEIEEEDESSEPISEEEEVIEVEVVDADKEEENASVNAPAKEDAKPIISNIETNDQPVVPSKMEKLKSYSNAYLYYGLLMILFLIILTLALLFVRRKRKQKNKK